MNWLLVLVVIALAIFALRVAYVIGKDRGWKEAWSDSNDWWSDTVDRFARQMKVEVPDWITFTVEYRKPGKRTGWRKGPDPDWLTTLENVYTHDFTENEEVKKNED